MVSGSSLVPHAWISPGMADRVAPGPAPAQPSRLGGCVSVACRRCVRSCLLGRVPSLRPLCFLRGMMPVGGPPMGGLIRNASDKHGNSQNGRGTPHPHPVAYTKQLRTGRPYPVKPSPRIGRLQSQLRKTCKPSRPEQKLNAPRFFKVGM